MKLQNLTILFIILIIPIALVMGLYIRGQGDTLTLQNKYDKALSSSTYDAVSAYRINTQSNEMVDNADSIREDIKAATNTFMMSMASSLNIAKDDVKAYVPAMLYTLYDGYYIYSAVKDDVGNIDYTLKPFVYYSETIKDDTNGINIVINYTLDNYIAIYGTVKVGTETKYIARSGYLIDTDKYEYDGTDLYYKIKDNDGNVKKYLIKTEILSENVQIKIEKDVTPITDEDGVVIGYEKYDYQTYDLKYRYVDQKKVYYLEADIIDKNGVLYSANKWYTYSSTKGELVESDYTGDGASGYVEDDSAIKYYQDAIAFTNYLLGDGTGLDLKRTIENGSQELKDKLGFLIINESNDPEDYKSKFCEHKREVIRGSIETNLKNAISTFNSMSQALGTTYNFKMPILLEEDWEKIYTEVSMTTFFQGLPIGFKSYNNYSIISVTGNKQFVNPELLYFIGQNADGTQSDEYHKITCDGLQTDIGYRSIDFEQYKTQEVAVDENGNELGSSTTSYQYYYKHNITGDYNCIIQDQTEIGVYEDGYFSEKLITSNDATAYFTTLARERYNQYKATGYLNKEYNVAEEEPVVIPSLQDFKYKIILNSNKATASYDIELNGTTTAYNNIATTTIKEGIIYASSWTDATPTEYEFNYAINQTATEEGFYRIDDTMNANIKFTIEKKDTGEIELKVLSVLECSIPSNPSNKDRYGDTVISIREDITNPQDIKFYIDINNTPRTYIGAVSNVNLNVILKQKENIDLEPEINDIKGEITVIYFVGDSIKFTRKLRRYKWRI